MTSDEPRDKAETARSGASGDSGAAPKDEPASAAESAADKPAGAAESAADKPAGAAESAAGKHAGAAESAAGKPASAERPSLPAGERPSLPAGDRLSKEPSAEAARRERNITIAIAVACVLIAIFVGRFLGSGGAPSGAPTTGSTAAPADPAAAEVSAGIAAKDPNQAVAHFRRALEIYPGHYGATYQLARALDRAGRKDEALAEWERVLKLAERNRDQPLVQAARDRLAQADPMTLGLDALYNKRDPAAAIARFREVLAQNPEHYGATYQLATALDQTGDTGASRPLWEKMLRMAEAHRDSKSADTARARLAEIDKTAPPAGDDPDADAMREGVDALYKKRDPAAAAAVFKKILARKPDHYGATFQLATALDQAGKASEAKPLWEKVLKLAEAAQDTPTADAARARLGKKP